MLGVPLDIAPERLAIMPAAGNMPGASGRAWLKEPIGVTLADEGTANNPPRGPRGAPPRPIEPRPPGAACTMDRAGIVTFIPAVEKVAVPPVGTADVVGLPKTLPPRIPPPLVAADDDGPNVDILTAAAERENAPLDDTTTFGWEPPAVKAAEEKAEGPTLDIPPSKDGNALLSSVTVAAVAAVFMAGMATVAFGVMDDTAGAGVENPLRADCSRSGGMVLIWTAVFNCAGLTSLVSSGGNNVFGEMLGGTILVANMEGAIAGTEATPVAAVEAATLKLGILVSCLSENSDGADALVPASMLGKVEPEPAAAVAAGKKVIPEVVRAPNFVLIVDEVAAFAAVRPEKMTPEDWAASAGVGRAVAEILVAAPDENAKTGGWLVVGTELDGIAGIPKATRDPGGLDMLDLAKKAGRGGAAAPTDNG